jgi:hypothetical protein
VPAPHFAGFLSLVGESAEADNLRRRFAKLKRMKGEEAAETEGRWRDQKAAAEKSLAEWKEQQADIARLEGMDINAQPIVAVEALLAGVELDEEEEMREMLDEILAEEMVQG